MTLSFCKKGETERRDVRRLAQEKVRYKAETTNSRLRDADGIRCLRIDATFTQWEETGLGFLKSREERRKGRKKSGGEKNAR